MSEGIGINIWTIAFQVTNFFVLMYLLNRFLYKPVMSMLEARKKEVSKIIEDKKHISDQQELLKAEKAVLIRQAKEEINKMRTDAKAEIHKLMETETSHAKAEALRIKAEAQSNIELELKNRLAEIDKEIEQRAIQLFEKIVQSELTDKQKKHFTSVLLTENTNEQQ